MRWLCVLWLLPVVAWAEGPWERVRTEADGLVLETRAVADSRFREVRVTGHSDASPAALSQTVWTWTEGRYVEQRKVLEQHETERLEWQLVQAPMISKRESVIRFERSATTTRATVHYDAVPAALKASGTVPMAVLRGGWTFERDPQGGTRVEHRCLSDPGGAVPEWLARGTQQEVAVELVRALLHRTH